MYHESKYLAHYGIRGQKWGQRRFQYENGSYTPEGKERYRKSASPQTSSANRGKPSRRASGLARGLGPLAGGVYDNKDGTKDMNRLKKDAKKDAEEMARAKAYYGEGAGNRRKQIRNRISERMKDPDYKTEYEKQLAAQDMSKHQKAANRERHVQDAKNTAAKTARGIKNLLMGVGSASIAAIALYNAAKLTGADKKIAELGKKAVADISSKIKSAKKPSVKDYNWHPNNGPSQYQNRPQRRDFVERNDRAKHGRAQPYIDNDGNIHWH